MLTGPDIHPGLFFQIPKSPGIAKLVYEKKSLGIKYEYRDLLIPNVIGR